MIAFLFFSLVAVIFMESTMALKSAHHFRAHLVAENLADSGAELAAASMRLRRSSTVSTKTDDGTISGTYELHATADPDLSTFIITGVGVSSGVDPIEATVKVYGTMSASGSIHVESTFHSQTISRGTTGG